MHGVVCIGAPSTIYLFRVSSSAGSIGTYLASQSSHLNVFLLLLHLPAGLPFFSYKMAMYVHFILLLWANFCTKVSCTSMLLSSISYSRYCSTASTTQHITNGSQRRIASTCPSESDNASKQTVEEREYCRAFIQHAEVSKRRNGNLHIPKTHTTTHTSLV